jgi:hypothetical protein
MRLLQKSSCLIFIHTLTSIIYNQWPDVIISASLGVSSVYHHSKYTKTSLILDRIMTAIYTARLLQLYHSNYAVHVLLAIGYGYLCYSYIYGYYNKCYCFHRDRSKGDRYHAVNHIMCGVMPSIIIIWNGGANILEKIENTAYLRL